jgi:hypothetical protein
MRSNLKPVLFFFFLVFISHVYLPFFNNRNDWFIFSSWALFGYPERKTTYDFSWDNGKSYFFRDYRDQARQAGINTQGLYYLINIQTRYIYSAEGFTFVNSTYISQIKKLCSCSNVSLYKLNLTVFEHIFLHKEHKSKELFKL